MKYFGSHQQSHKSQSKYRSHWKSLGFFTHFYLYIHPYFCFGVVFVYTNWTTKWLIWTCQYWLYIALLPHDWLMEILHLWACFQLFLHSVAMYDLLHQCLDSGLFKDAIKKCHVVLEGPSIGAWITIIQRATVPTNNLWKSPFLQGGESHELSFYAPPKVYYQGLKASDVTARCLTDSDAEHWEI